MPAFLRRSYLVLKSTTIGSEAGEPPAISRALDNLAVPLVSDSPFCEPRVASKSRRPPSPNEESRKPVEARLRELTLSLALTGVSEALVRSRGPTLPSNLNLPPSGKSAATITENLVATDTSEAEMLT